MLEKLLLASMLTLSFSLFTNIGWSNPRKKTVQTPLSDQIFVTLTQVHQNAEID